jgi:hypothetical protein
MCSIKVLMAIGLSLFSIPSSWGRGWDPSGMRVFKALSLSLSLSFVF